MGGADYGTARVHAMGQKTLLGHLLLPRRLQLLALRMWLLHRLACRLLHRLACCLPLGGTTAATAAARWPLLPPL